MLSYVPCRYKTFCFAGNYDNEKKQRNLKRPIPANLSKSNCLKKHCKEVTTSPQHELYEHRCNHHHEHVQQSWQNLRLMI